MDSEQRLCQLKCNNQKTEAELCTLRSALAVSEQLSISLEQQLSSNKKQRRGEHQLQTKLRESERQRLLLDEQLELEKSERRKLLNTLRLSERQLFKVSKEAAHVVESYKLRLQAQEVQTCTFVFGKLICARLYLGQYEKRGGNPDGEGAKGSNR